MKKAIYFAPAILVGLFYTFIIIEGGIQSLDLIFATAVLMLLISSGYLLSRNYVLGSIPGILIGCSMIYSNAITPSMFIDLFMIGAVFIVYYCMCSIIVLVSKQPIKG